MPREFACPACGEREDLSGRRRGEEIFLTCGSCGHEWPRDAVHVCATCGGSDLQERAQALTQYSRGTQLSIVGWHQVRLCEVCDAAMLRRAVQGKPVPPTYRPAATTRRGDDEGDDGGDVQILPS